jgi:hypothetical protein
MMASDGLQHGVEFIFEPLRQFKRSDDIIALTSPSSIVSVLATFHCTVGKMS